MKSEKDERGVLRAVRRGPQKKTPFPKSPGFCFVSLTHDLYFWFYYTQNRALKQGDGNRNLNFS